MIVGVREIGSPLANQIKGEHFGQEYQGPAGTRVVADIAKAAKQTGQGDMDDAWRKAVINLAGDFMRLPSAQINRTITGFNALREGETKNPLALIAGYQKP